MCHGAHAVIVDSRQTGRLLQRAERLIRIGCSRGVDGLTQPILPICGERRETRFPLVGIVRTARVDAEESAFDEIARHHRPVLLEKRIDVPTHQHLPRSEEHTSELQSLMRISYAVFCLKKKKKKHKKD